MPKAFSREFRERAVEMVLTDGKSVGVVALQLGVSASGLDRWVRQAKVDRGMVTRTVLSPSDVQAENVALRKEVRRLRDELEIVKRAAALFAKDNVLPK